MKDKGKFLGCLDLCIQILNLPFRVGYPRLELSKSNQRRRELIEEGRIKLMLMLNKARKNDRYLKLSFLTNKVLV